MSRPSPPPPRKWCLRGFPGRAFPRHLGESDTSTETCCVRIIFRHPALVVLPPTYVGTGITNDDQDATHSLVGHQILRDGKSSINDVLSRAEGLLECGGTTKFLARLRWSGDSVGARHSAGGGRATDFFFRGGATSPWTTVAGRGSSYSSNGCLRIYSSFFHLILYHPHHRRTSSRSFGLEAEKLPSSAVVFEDTTNNLTTHYCIITEETRFCQKCTAAYLHPAGNLLGGA